MKATAPGSFFLNKAAALKPEHLRVTPSTLNFMNKMKYH